MKNTTKITFNSKGQETSRKTVPDEQIDETQVINNIKEAFESLSGDEISEIHNNVCADQIEYLGDSEWKYIKKE